MSRITVDNVAAAIRKVRAMSVKDKETLADEIYLHQPHLLASWPGRDLRWLLAC